MTDFSVAEIEYWIKAYELDLRKETMASEDVKRSWRMVIAGLRLLLKEAKR